MDVNFKHCSQNVAIFDPSNNCPTEPCHLWKQKNGYTNAPKTWGNQNNHPRTPRRWRMTSLKVSFYPQLRPGSGSLPTLKEPKYSPWPTAIKGAARAKCDLQCATQKNPSWKNTWPWWHNTSRNQNSKLRRKMVIFKICIPSTSSSQTIY